MKLKYGALIEVLVEHTIKEDEHQRHEREVWRTCMVTNNTAGEDEFVAKECGTPVEHNLRYSDKEKTWNEIETDDSGEI